jgi:hypothetical protein
VTRADLATVARVEHQAPVTGERVECWLAGSVEIARCRECDYLVGLEWPSGGNPPRVICEEPR